MCALARVISASPSCRTDAPRPFPYLRAIDPLDYAYGYLRGVELPKIVYRSVSGMDREALAAWLRRLDGFGGAVVLVGAPSGAQAVTLKLGEAYRVRAEATPALPVGGVVIAERHRASGGEIERLEAKRARGCAFFVSQTVFSVTATKDLLSDLHYRCREQETPAPPILVTLSPCGSRKTLDFMQWLGVSVPRWMRNELVHAHDILERSVELSVTTFEQIFDFAREKDLPIGCNVESVSTRKDEIEASVELVHRVARLLGRT